jgi:hypothetical protein
LGSGLTGRNTSIRGLLMCVICRSGLSAEPRSTISSEAYLGPGGVVGQRFTFSDGPVRSTCCVVGDDGMVQLQPIRVMQSKRGQPPRGNQFEFIFVYLLLGKWAC